MLMNLAMPWDAKCSPPEQAELAFYSRDSDDLLFTSPAAIEILCQAKVRSVAMNWTLARNAFVRPFREGPADALPGNLFRIRLAATGLHPGFYDLRVNLNAGQDCPRQGICTFGYRVEELAVLDSRPADFAEFWQKAIGSLQAISLDARTGPMLEFTRDQINQYNVVHACLPPDYDPAGHCVETVESSKISFAGPGGKRVYAWLAKPKGPGPFPALLVLPGAGFAARPRPLEHARHGYLAIDTQIHAQDVDLPKYESLPGYFDGFVYTPVSSYYYYNVYLRVVQAVNYLMSRHDVLKPRIAAVGGSQGGRLALVAAALDQRIKAIVPAIPYGSNQPYLDWAQACNRAAVPGISSQKGTSGDGMELAGPPKTPQSAETRCTAYYDPMNFAPDIQCPVLMNVGLIDPVSPPASVFSAYNRLGCVDKRIAAMPGLAHDWSAEFDRRAWQWLKERLAADRG